jgi:dCTP diphosphatase
MDVEALTRRLREFASARDWEQFHSPKNLAMALSAEVGELTEIFQWLTAEESTALRGEDLDRVREEIADVQIYLLRLADVLGIEVGRPCRARSDSMSEVPGWSLQGQRDETP